MWMWTPLWPPPSRRPIPSFTARQNTVAANPENKVPSEQPQISGTQDKVVKTVAPGAAPGRPRCSPRRPRERKTETATAERRKQETAESKALPKPAYTPGDLAEAKPAPKAQETKGTSDIGHWHAAPPPQPAHVNAPALWRKPGNKQGAPGPRMRQAGRRQPPGGDSSVDAARTVYGDYDRDFIDAVQARWFELLKGRQDDVAGKVVLEFNLHADGRISDMKMQFSDVNESAVAHLPAGGAGPGAFTNRGRRRCAG